VLGVVYVTPGTFLAISAAAAIAGTFSALAVLSTLIFPILGLRLRDDIAAGLLTAEAEPAGGAAV